LNESDSRKYEATKAQVLELKSKGTKILFCAMGSVSGGYSSICKPFYERLIRVIESIDNVSLILLTDSLEKLNTTQNVFILPSAPQTDILKYADIFIFHGGMGSLNEGIEYETPMIVYPMNKEGDNLGDAARLCYHKMGVRGDLKDDEIKIKKTIEEVLLKLENYKHNIVQFKEANPYISEDDFIKLIAL
jgi:UDP:flavonoid glycosyltransferase YjiC (YdhE family)